MDKELFRNTGKKALMAVTHEHLHTGPSALPPALADATFLVIVLPLLAAIAPPRFPVPSEGTRADSRTRKSSTAPRRDGVPLAARCLWPSEVGCGGAAVAWGRGGSDGAVPATLGRAALLAPPSLGGLALWGILWMRSYGRQARVGRGQPPSERWDGPRARGV